MIMDSVELEYIKQCLTYDPLKGTLHWRISIPNLGIQIGGIAGNQSDKYTRVKLKGKKYPAHVVGWYLHTGEWCIGQLDHIDRNMQNNKIANLLKLRVPASGTTLSLPSVISLSTSWEITTMLRLSACTMEST